MWNLTGGAVHACDATNASRTQLLNLRTAGWDAELLALFAIPRRHPAGSRPSSGVFGEARRFAALEGMPIASAIGDSHAALFGHAAFAPGQVKATYGTGSSLMTIVPAPVRSRHGLSTTVAWASTARVAYALEGNITVTGGAVDWLGQFLGLRLRRRRWRIWRDRRRRRRRVSSSRRSPGSARRTGTPTRAGSSAA